MSEKTPRNVANLAGRTALVSALSASFARRLFSDLLRVFTSGLPDPFRASLAASSAKALHGLGLVLRAPPALFVPSDQVEPAAAAEITLQ